MTECSLMKGSGPLTFTWIIFFILLESRSLQMVIYTLKKEKHLNKIHITDISFFSLKLFYVRIINIQFSFNLLKLLLSS